MPTPIIDFHTHAFADPLAAKAIPILEQKSHTSALLSGRIPDLLSSMKHAGVSRSVVCPIATQPHHFHGIRRWATAVRNAHPQLEMFLSIHPNDPNALPHIDQIAADGFKGVKFHPFYQNFTVDDPRLFPLYERLASHHLLAIFHAGFDIGYPHDRIADPIRFRRLIDAFPAFRIIISHFGGWLLWDEALRYLAGLDVYIETSFSLPYLPPTLLRRLLNAFPHDRLLFGTDSPWTDPAAEIMRWHALPLPKHDLNAILGGNAARLLNASP